MTTPLWQAVITGSIFTYATLYARPTYLQAISMYIYIYTHTHKRGWGSPQWLCLLWAYALWPYLLWQAISAGMGVAGLSVSLGSLVTALPQTAQACGPDADGANSDQVDRATAVLP